MAAFQMASSPSTSASALECFPLLSVHAWIIKTTGVRRSGTSAGRAGALVDGAMRRLPSRLGDGDDGRVGHGA
jgi:hypothetical protein